MSAVAGRVVEVTPMPAAAGLVERARSGKPRATLTVSNPLEAAS